MSQVRDRIALYVEKHFNIASDEAHKIRHSYWKKYGTTLGGLMAEHAVDPYGYLDFVHDVDMTLLQPAADLRDQIEALPGRKLIFTNADAPSTARLLQIAASRGHALHPAGALLSDADWPAPAGDSGWHRMMTRNATRIAAALAPGAALA